MGLKPTGAMLANAGRGSAGARDAPSKERGQIEQGQAKGTPEQSPEMKSLVARFQQAMGRIKALEASKATEAGALKKATIAAGNLSAGPKGIVAANAALDLVEAQIERHAARRGHSGGRRTAGSQEAGERCPASA